MLHNKYFKILALFTDDYTKQIHGRKLIDKIDISQKGIALTLKELEKKTILKSKKEGNMKFYSLNLKNPHIKEIMTITEIEKKIVFLEKNKSLAHIFKDDTRVVGIFGSYAMGMEQKSSDIDVFIVGKTNNNDYNLQGKELDLDLHIIYFTEKEFNDLLNQKNNIIKEIVKNHVILFGVEQYMRIVWDKYYGFN